MKQLVNLMVSTTIAQQLQNLLPTILAQDDVRNVIVNNDRKGFTYKEFLACNLKEYDGKGGPIVYTRWIEKMKSVQDMSGCVDNQKVKCTAGSFVGKALTWRNSQIHTQSREAAVRMSWEDFKNLTREEFCPVNAIEDMAEDESYLIPHLIGDRLCVLPMLTKVFMADMWWWRNRGGGGSISMILGRGGGWFVIRSMDLNDGSGGALVVLDAGGGVVSGGGVVLEVMSSSVEEVLCGAKGVIGGDSRCVDGGTTL
uniref:Reverse transcriptase domain-containing protein n=1 Tax=Tanacetum cinerariifolium TaxID=118510 RepID=A0A6L2L1R6_TANCI|nr:hypothetical protein [Tanacetum cinerariifolium]